MYTSGQNLYELLKQSGQSNAPRIDTAYKHVLPEIIDLFNVEHRVAGHTLGCLRLPDFAGSLPAQSAILSTFHKNQFLLFAAVELSRSGLYGSANNLLRSIYEGLLIAKFCSFQSSTDVFDKWSNGKYVQVTNDIFNKIKKPEPIELRDILRGLNQVSHATVYSQQIAYEYDDMANEVGQTLSLIHIF